MNNKINKIRELSKYGQSIWFDFIRRSFIESGELQNLIDEGVLGVTSNPSIFEKAIAGSSDYDNAIKELVVNKKSDGEIYEELVIEDIGQAADLFQPVYISTNGIDGYVSLEVSPTLAHDTKGTIEDALRLYKKLSRPNVMIKVPATKEGIPAIESLIGSGININVTLMFNMQHYQDVVEAYISGLEKLQSDGKDLSKVSSVASFFISRVDSAIDIELESRGNKNLQGKIAIANSKLVYKEFQKMFSSSRWKKLEIEGAKIQRLLWASTGTKNPNYPDTYYVDELIGNNTVNTVPPSTLNNFRDHGNVKETITRGLKESSSNVSELANLSIDLDSITEKLQNDGLKSFKDSFISLMNSIKEKRNTILNKTKKIIINSQTYSSLYESSLMKIKKDKIIHRIWNQDHSVWDQSSNEISNRLGWLNSPEVMLAQVPAIQNFVEDIITDGYTKVILLGMGGSSLAPEVFYKIFGKKERYLDLEILDSTNPDKILELKNSIDFEKTLFIIATKSGSTVETLSFLKYFYNQSIQYLGSEEIGRNFVAITDPGSSLEALSKELSFRKTFLNDPNIGGRYSALSYFGIVPAALIGVDITKLLDNALQIKCNCDSCNCAIKGDNNGTGLGVFIGQMAKIGHNKLTFIISEKFAPFGAWVEQLIAESTGKDGVGVLPIVGESITASNQYRDDRVFVYIKSGNDNKFDEVVSELEKSGYPTMRVNLKDRYELGGQFFLWEFATALSGHILNINPFDQPNVESAKILAKEMVSEYINTNKLPIEKPSLKLSEMDVYTTNKVNNIKDVIDNIGEHIKNIKSIPFSYLSIQAFLKPTPKMDKELQDLRTNFQTKYNIATTVGYGPRFLHSTGQLHKGDDGNGIFIQLTSDYEKDLPIPKTAEDDSSLVSFGILLQSQTLGDRQALLNSNRNVIRFHLKDDATKAISKLSEEL